MAGGKKPLFILPNLGGGGAERATLQLLTELIARGFEPTLLVLRRQGAFLREVPPELRLVCAMEPGEKLYWHASGFIRTLLQLARDSDVVVGALELEPCYFAWLAGRMTRRPAVGWIHAVMSEHLHEVSPIHTTLARLIYPRMEKLVFPSHGSADSLGSLMSLDRGKIEVIPSAVERDHLQALSAQAMPEWAAEVFRKPTVISVGRMVPSKGLDILIRAHARVRRAGIDHNLLIVGEGRLRGELESLADSLGARASVFMPGFMTNPYPLMKAAEVLAVSSRFESLSLVLLEAMAVSCAIVATDCPGGTRELLQRAPDGDGHGKSCGLIVAANDEVALAGGISRLLGDSEMREALKSAAVARAREFSSEVLVPRWERLLEELAK